MDTSILTKTLNRKALMGLALTFALSFVNLAGAFLALTAFGGIEPWTDAQFVGLFGTIETGVGLAFLFAPNVWRLPVAEASTRTDVRLAASTVLIPHWLAAAKAGGGIVMLGYAMAVEGVAAATVGIIPAVIFIGIGFLAFAVSAARLGAQRPDLDVLFVSVRRPGGKQHDLPGISLSGVGVQFLANIGIFPAVELLQPSALFRPELVPSFQFVAVTAAVASGLLALAWVAWRGRITWRAPAEQQREAEAELTSP